MSGLPTCRPCKTGCSKRCLWLCVVLFTVLCVSVIVHTSILSGSTATTLFSSGKEGASKAVHSLFAQLTQAGTTFGKTSDLSPSLSNAKAQTVGSHELTEAEVASRFKKRRKVLRAACRKYSNSSFVFRHRTIGIVQTFRYPPVMNLTVGYCPIAKVGSTTWKAVFKSIDQVLRKRKIPAIPTKTAIRERDVLFTFVREPYGRLLSGYMDKLFSPNDLYWQKVGRYIVQQFRHNPTELSLRCGHDVTFPEFIKYVIHAQTTGQKRDPHFIPIHDQCEMCKYPYTFIGHLETLQEDMPFILKAIQSPIAYERPFSNQTIRSGADMALRKMRNKILKCISLDDASRRVWKKFQTRGLIHKSLLFPLTREQTQDISAEELAEAGLSALALSRERSETKGQKREALSEAFSGVDMADRHRLQRLLMADFDMLGFDPHPPEVFHPAPHPPDSDLSYFDLYK